MRAVGVRYCHTEVYRKIATIFLALTVQVRYKELALLLVLPYKWWVLCTPPYSLVTTRQLTCG